ncbi:ORF1 [torque teno Delphinidae virus 55]
MCAYPYRRRRRFRRRFGGFRARRRFYRRYRRYRPWYRRRFRVRRRRGRRRRRRGRWRRRFRRWRRRRGIGPWPVKQYAPPVRVTCYIRGRYPCMYFTHDQMNLPFIDPPSGVHLGGSICCQFWNLDFLYHELVAQRCTWSKSNFGMEYGRFYWCKFKFYRTENYPYIITWYQGKAAEEPILWRDMHPAVSMNKRKKILMKCNKMMSQSRRYTTKRLFLRPPTDTETKWYPMCELATMTLARLCYTLCNLENPWYYLPYNPTDFKGYYISVGFHTPDRRTLGQKYQTDEKYPDTQWRIDGYQFTSPYTKEKIYMATNTIMRTGRGSSVAQVHLPWIKMPCRPQMADKICYTELSQTPNMYAPEAYKFKAKYPATEFDNMPTTTMEHRHDYTDEVAPYSDEQANAILTNWATWGGPMNIKISYKQNVTYCDDVTGKFRWTTDVCASYDLQSPPIRVVGEMCGNMNEICKNHKGKILGAGISFSSGRPKNIVWDHLSPTIKLSNFQCYRRINAYDRGHSGEGPRVQGFWPGKYSWFYDRGRDNVVWGIYIPTNQPSSTLRGFAYSNLGPGTGNEKQFATIRVSEGIPYYQEFYCHTYSSYLRFLNVAFPQVFKLSMGGQGFVGVGILTWPSEDVRSGPFQAGYCPLVYRGKNWEYFTKEANEYDPWTKYWPHGQSHPPLKHNLDIDWDCKIFCFLSDGRPAMFGSGLEGSLTQEAYKRPVLWATHDDVREIGLSGPYVQREFIHQSGCVNVSLSYKFKFKWGGRHHPGKWQEIYRPSSFCLPGSHPMPPGYPDPDGYIPQGSPGKRQARDVPHHPRIRYRDTGRSRSRRSADPGPLDPREVSAMHYDSEADLTDGGFHIRDEVMDRLMYASPETGEGLPGPRPPVGTRIENALWDAYRERIADCEPCSSSSDSDESSSSGEEATARSLWPFAAGLPEVWTKKKPQHYRRAGKSVGEAHGPPQKQQRGRRGAIPAPASPTPGVSSVDLKHLLQHREQLRLVRQLTHKLSRKRSLSCTDLNCDSL